MKVIGIIYRRLLRSQAQYPLFSRGGEVRLENDLLLLNARAPLSRKLAKIRCQRTDATGRERKKNAPAQAKCPKPATMGDLSSPEKTEVTFKNTWTEHAPFIKYKRENFPPWVKEERNIICNLQNSIYDKCLKLPLGI